MTKILCDSCGQDITPCEYTIEEMPNMVHLKITIERFGSSNWNPVLHFCKKCSDTVREAFDSNELTFHSKVKF